MALKISFKGMLEVFKKSFIGFDEDKVTKLSGSLAYYTVFSMAPLLIVIISYWVCFWVKKPLKEKFMIKWLGL